MWTRRSLSRLQREESRRFPVAGRPQSWAWHGECAGHHRGLRAGQASIGVARALGRAICLLVHMAGVGDRMTQGPGVVGGLRPDPEPFGDNPNARKHARDRGASDKRRASRRAEWPSSRRIVPGKVGNRGPGDPREGRRRRVARCAGRKDGRDYAITHRHTPTPADGGAGRPRPRSGVPNVGAPDR